MGFYKKNWTDDSTLEFPHAGFWIFHIVGPILIFIWGMRFAMRHVPLPFLGYRFLRKLVKR
jgi:hypothetical protein